ncbi:MAG: serine hydrolase [Saprospiraceae bacterium]
MKTILIFFFGLFLVSQLNAYPIDGYDYTGIRRLLYLQRILNGEIKAKPLIPGAQKKLEEIHLNLYGTSRCDSLWELPAPDPHLQSSLDSLFPHLNESYSIALLDITPGRPIRYASRQEDRGFQPGSVGKLAVLAGLMCELDNLYPDSFELRRQLMKTTIIKAGPFGVYDEHTVPFFDPETNNLVRRQVQQTDIFSLYEWVDHMLSVSNNGAACVVWRESMLMRAFGLKYKDLTYDQKMDYFKTTPRKELADLAVAVVSDPLRSMGIAENEWRLGTMFTDMAGRIVPPKGGSIGTPRALMKYLVTIEQGAFIDYATCLEMKRLMYMTGPRIRYAANANLKDAAVFFKSGSLYHCRPEAGYSCGKYKGNLDNYMNSVAIIEHDDGRVYFVALMSNVLRKNSNLDHNMLAGRIDKLITPVR